MGKRFLSLLSKLEKSAILKWPNGVVITTAGMTWILAVLLSQVMQEQKEVETALYKQQLELAERQDELRLSVEERFSKVAMGVDLCIRFGKPILSFNILASIIRTHLEMLSD